MAGKKKIGAGLMTPRLAKLDTTTKPISAKAKATKPGKAFAKVKKGAK